MRQPGLSVIIPTLNEAETLEARLERLLALRACGVEIIIVDGGSQDETITQASRVATRVIESPQGRAVQMNAGAHAATAGQLLFLHADTQLPQRADRLVDEALAGRHRWGRFDIRLEGRHPMLPVIGTAMNWRSRLTGIATGDQALFMARSAFDEVGGFPDQPLMEDIALSRLLRRLSPPACLRQRVSSSGRRWEHNGAWPTILLMWWLRYRYWRGEAPEQLARAYRDVR